MDQTSQPNRRILRFSAAPSSCAEDGLSVREPAESYLILPSDLLCKTMDGLQKRSAGWRESAGVWAGHVTEDHRWQAEELYLHHDLCDDRGTPLSLELTEAAKFRLYENLALQQLRLVALIHTHPRAWVDLSVVDQSNQLGSRVGFWSVVVPWYARTPWRVGAMGFHVRRPTGWYRLSASEVRKRVQIRE